MPSPFDNLQANVNDVIQLFKLHKERGGDGPGRRHDLEVLNKSAIVLTSACWEAFVEDVVTVGAQALSTNTPTPDKLPKEVRKALSTKLRDDKNELAAWKLAGAGWQSFLVTHAKQLTDSFHSPRPARVDDILERTLGLCGVSASWHWSGMSAADARAKLDALVDLRGEIAHRVSTTNSVKKGMAVDYAKFVLRLAHKTNNAVRLHVHGVTGKHPWRGVKLQLR